MAEELETRAQADLASMFRSVFLNATEEQLKSDTTSAHMCAVCDTAAKLCCSACDTTYLPPTEAEERRWYCGKECQAKDWKSHKEHCKEIQAKVDVQGLHRAAKLLQRLFVLFRELTYESSVVGIQRKGDVLHVEARYDSSCMPPPGFQDLESTFNLQPEDCDMVSTILACNHAFFHMQELCAMFLQETNIASKIREKHVVTRRGPRGWRFKQDINGFEFLQTSDQMPEHCFYQITLKTGTKWAMDLTSAQFGYDDKPVPLDTYAAHRVANSGPEYHFGYLRDRWFRNIPVNNPRIPRFDEKDPVSMKEVTDWCQFQISRVMVDTVKAMLARLNVSPDQLLRRTSEDRFEAIMGSLICVTWASMSEKKLQTKIRISELRDTGKVRSNRP